MLCVCGKHVDNTRWRVLGAYKVRDTRDTNLDQNRNDYRHSIIRSAGMLFAECPPRNETYFRETETLRGEIQPREPSVHSEDRFTLRMLKDGKTSIRDGARVVHAIPHRPARHAKISIERDARWLARDRSSHVNLTSQFQMPCDCFP